MKKDFVIKILFIEHSVEDAEQIISLLRNTGIAVRPARATAAGQVQTALAELEPDLVMFDPGNGAITLPEVIRMLDAQGSDYSVLGLVGTLDNQQVATLFEQGVHGIVTRGMPGQLLAVLRREFDALQNRRMLRRLESTQRELERRCDALLDSSRDAITYVHEGVHVRANQAYLEAFGHESFDDLLGMPILDMIDAASVDEFKNLLRGHTRQEKLPNQVSLRARRADGSPFDATVEFAPATFEGEPCLQIVFRRQTIDPAMLEQLQRDPVTGLYNRAHMLECIDHAVIDAAKGKKGQALLLIEPDNWSSMVGGIGLAKADELLASFSDRVRILLGANDTAGMLAEHTLGVILDSRPDEAIREWIAKLQQSIAGAIFDAGSRSITATASIGGSLLGEKNANTELLLNQASQALRTAQSLGSNQADLHDPSAREKADEERERYWLDLLRKALDDKGLMLYHQHTISLQDAEGDYSEILLRMDGPQGEVLPGFFMPIADKHGLTGAIDRWVLDQAIAALQRREGMGQQTTFFVKFTAASLQDPSLLDWLGERLAQAGLKRGRLVLEMTESKVMTLLRPAQEFLAGWKKLGGRFALEQFGSGLNSFQLLSHIDADYLKIDRSYMADLPKSPDNQKKVTEICQQARELKKQTIAEWVEDATSTSLLFAAGVDFVQGNFLQVPQRLD
ncbi:GGDEF domain-containing phosphodiesterase [Rhodanobacter sp. DHB23]|uniref:EAL domain-containing response regulator n=1 Tax=Rhodanobacter sp. DHB23 TaxID=2775923 RepID=UPI001784D35F|nr:GGDEF domain-containing phosphodiesterase [Rhodanobacter sp. DHB23]MBD8873007.1 EAL domain-containing protein [Rhodanobacter sp. DHB23]